MNANKKLFKLCIDPGHGMNNAKRGVLDTGAVYGSFRENEIALTWGLELLQACRARGVDAIITRASQSVSTPLSSRVPRAVQARCTHFLSLHVNDADDMSANGVETLYRRKESLSFAKLVQDTVRPILGLKDRGIKQRSNLAVLASPAMRSALLEVGFIGNLQDRRIFAEALYIRKACEALARTFEAGNF